MYKRQPHQAFRIASANKEETRVDTKAIRETLEKDVELYLANGGIIQVIPSEEVENSLRPAHRNAEYSQHFSALVA